VAMYALRNVRKLRRSERHVTIMLAIVKIRTWLGTLFKNKIIIDIVSDLVKLRKIITGSVYLKNIAYF